jgi:cytochrome b561
MRMRLRLPKRENAAAPGRDPPTRYSRTAIAIHWLTAAALMLSVALALRMSDAGGAERERVLTVHMSVGFVILLLTLLRSVWRATHRPPPLAGIRAWERRAAVATHAAFYVLLLVVPILGWLFIATSSAGPGDELLGFVPWPSIPGVAGNTSLGALAESAHRILAYSLCVLVLIHTVGAIKHHLEDPDRGFARILPGARRLLGWRTGIVAACLAALFAIATSYEFAKTTGEVIAPINPRTARVFASVMQPILEEKCVACHGARTQKGGLRLDSFAALDQGGESGKALVPGKADESELVRRILLPPGHRDAMPPRDRAALTLAEGQLLLWWIEGGADESVTIHAADPPPLVQGILRTRGVSGESPVLTRNVTAPDPQALAKLRESFRVQFLFSGNGLLEVQRSFERDPQAPLSLDQLTGFAEQLVWLDLSGSRIPAKELSVLARLRNLQRLNLAGSGATDETIHAIRDLPHLETLNLYGTAVTDAALDSIGRMPSLVSLYLDATAVSAAAVERFRASHPQVQVVWNATAAIEKGTP